MPYDEKLASRIPQVLASQPTLSEREMFARISFRLGGNMCCDMSVYFSDTSGVQTKRCSFWPVIRSCACLPL